MAQNKAKDFIVHGLNLDIMEATIGRVNRLGTKPLGKRDKRKKVSEHMYTLNPSTNEITFTDECGTEWTIPLLTDTLSLISDTAIELVMH